MKQINAKVFVEVECFSGRVELCDDDGNWYGSFAIQACRVIDRNPDCQDERAQMRGSIFHRAMSIAVVNCAVCGGRLNQIIWG